MAGGKNRQRAALQNATVQYYNALKDVEVQDPLKNSPTNNARALKDVNGISYQAIRLALQADKLARSSNSQMPAVNEKIEKYNQRVGLLGRQLNGEDVSLGDRLEKVQNDPKFTSGKTLFNADGSLYQNNTFGNQQQDVYVKTPVTLGRIAPDYSTFGSAQSAYEDMSSLSSDIKNAASGIQANSDAYEAIHQQIKNYVRRAETVKPAGILGQGSELASATPYSDVIR